jgi:O-methyltransferase involved in polyketide biosynthesis
MAKKSIVRPDSTAVRVALWRGLHLEVDPPPHLIEDKIGLELAAPKQGWRNRPDMKGPAVTRYRAESSYALGLLRIWSRNKSNAASANTLSWVRASIRLPSAGRISLLVLKYDAWSDHLTVAGFDPGQPAVVAAAGVSMYLTEDAIVFTLQRVARFAPGSTFAMTFLSPPELRFQFAGWTLTEQPVNTFPIYSSALYT